MACPRSISCTAAIAACVAMTVAAQPDVTAPMRFVDDAGRAVMVPGEVERVFAAGAPADLLLYTLAPWKLAGRNNVPSAATQAWMPAEYRNPVPIRELPNAHNADRDAELLALAPDLYVDYGTLSEEYIESVAAVSLRTGVPGVIFNGAFENLPAVYRKLGALIGEPERGQRLAAEIERVLDKYRNALADPAIRPKVYVACSHDGEVPCYSGHPFGEAVDWLGAENVAGAVESAPGRPVTAAEVVAWAPDVLVVPSAEARERLLADAAWREIPAIATGHVYAPPALPYTWGWRPPSVNRIPGLVWMAYVLPDRPLDEVFIADIQSLFALLYHIDVSEAQIRSLLAQ